MSLSSRFPQQWYSLPNWKRYLNLGILRYSSLDRDSTFGTHPGEKGSNLYLGLTDEDFYDAFRLGKLASLLAYIADNIRWVGKGAKLCPTDLNSLNLEISDLVNASVSEYEKRRPRAMVFQDEGFLIPTGGPIESEYLLLELFIPQEIFRLYVPDQDLSLSCTYMPGFTDAKHVFDQLRNYEDPIEDLFNVSIDAIAHVLRSLAIATFNSFPEIERIENFDIVLAVDQDSALFEHKLKFMFGLCHKGSLRFSLAQWIENLSLIASPWGPTPEEAKPLVESFFNAFLLKTNEREKLDLSLLRPLPFVYGSPSGNVYVELSTIFDFLAWILDRAKDWYSSQHGDRFTLSLKRWIENHTDAKIICSKEKFPNKNGSQSEVDLLVLFNDSLYSIECKAMAKSRMFFRGDPVAIRQRRTKIKEAAQQAIRAAAAVQNALITGDNRLPAVNKVEWIVCTPTQEYLRPPDEFGFVTGTTPKVCTPEELVLVFSNKN